MSHVTDLTIQVALDAYAEANHDVRGDEKSLHVSDLSKCDRATWARITGQPLSHFTPDTLRKFTLGFAVEEHVLDAILDKLDPALERNVRVAFETDAVGVTGRRVPETFVPNKLVIVGHPDGVGADYVIEVKSTEFMVDRKTWKRIVPQTEDDLMYGYRIQCAAYALALKKPRCIVVVVCRATGLLSVIEFDPNNYLREILQQAAGLEDIMKHPEIMPDPTLHPSTINKSGQSWLCKYCDYLACPRNRKEKA